MIINNLGIIGYGRFGKLLADMLSDDFDILPYDANFSTGLSIEEVASADAIFLCVPIVELKTTIKNMAPLVQANTMILDVCSVKLYPESLMMKYFSNENILLTHPMFGPDAVKNGLNDLSIALCPTKDTKKEIIEYWSDVFKKHNLKVKLMSCEEHDRNTAYSLCLTQFIGRTLKKLELKSSEIDTQNFKNLLTR